jgi:CheY-like chemotaxis protein
MPELGGFKVAEMIRSHPLFHKTAIIFISAESLTDTDKLDGHVRELSFNRLGNRSFP